MLSYIHLTRSERICLAQSLKEKKSIRQIARELGRSPSTISREIKRNSSQKGYHHWRAEILSICRRRNHRRTALKPGSLEYQYVLQGLKKFWTPEQIAGRFSKDHPGRKICFATIYRRIKAKEFPGITAKSHLRRRGKNYNYVHHNSSGIQPDRTVLDWPMEIRNRSELGHWEGDTVYGGVGKGLLVTLVDRKSRFLLCARIFSRNASETRLAIEALLKDQIVRSITFDNGTEFAQFRLLEHHLGVPVFFAQPHKPWQRGSNENTNGLLRFFFPKGFDFRSLSSRSLDLVVASINNRPRKSLLWASPAEFSVALD